MKRALNILLEELRRLKQEGATVVHVSDNTLEHLRQKARVLAAPDAPVAAPTRSVAPAPPSETRARAKALIGESGRLPDFNPTPVAPAASKKAARKLPNPPKVNLPSGDKQTQWEALRKQVLECATCNAHLKAGCKVVFGTGSLDADIFFVGEAPGAEEELAGEPFVGAAGETLTRMIQAMGLQREGVYIANIMNWRPDMPGPAGNRPPTQEEMDFCLPYLLAQVDIVKPKVLVALGNTAVSGLFGADSKRKMREVRGQWIDFKGIPTMITFHPAYIVRNGSTQVKRTVWEDLLQVMEKVGLPVSEKQRGFFRPRT
jgi:uracil-DNA glycosylase